MVEAARKNSVFLSYSHDSDAHRDRVRQVSEQLCRDGLDVILDQFDASPDQGWPRWIVNGLAVAWRIVVICTATYCRRFEGRERLGVGRGVTWEGHVLMQYLYEENTCNARIRPVLLEGAEEQDVPIVLRAYTVYRLPANYDDLYRWLTAQNAPPPAIGNRRALPPRQS
jgi:hypothetical protein